MELRVVHIVPSLDHSAGGPSRCVLGLAQAQAECGAIVDLVSGGVGALYSSDAPDPSSTRMSLQCNGFRLHVGTVLSKRFSIPAPSFTATLHQAIKSADIIHLHSIWNGVITQAGWLGRWCKKPMILTPHGMLDAHNIQRRGIFKQLYMRLVEKRNLAAVDAFHFLDETERSGCDWLEPVKVRPAIIQPNGLDLHGLQKRHHNYSRQPHAIAAIDSNALHLVFLGRLNVIKGLELQLEVLADCLAVGLSVHLHWIGPDDGEWPRLRDLASQLGVTDALHWHGPIYGDERFAWLRQADAVLLTSHYECNSVMAGETLALGGVLLATDTCHLGRAAEARAACVVPRDRQQLANALIRLLREPEFGIDLRQAGVNFARAELDWSPLARQMIDFYRELLRRPALADFSGN